MLVITCPRCKKGNVWMAHFWAEYLCDRCLAKEKKSLRQRQEDAFNERQKAGRAGQAGQ